MSRQQTLYFKTGLAALLIWLCQGALLAQDQKPQPKGQKDQKEEPRMTKEQFLKDSAEIVKPKLVRAQFRFDNRNVFFKGQALSINGFDAGVLLKEKLRLAIGYYSFTGFLTAFNKTVDEVEYRRLLKLQYGSFNTEFVFKNTRFFSLGMPLDFGFGRNSLQYSSVVGDSQEPEQKGFIFITDFGLSATFKPMRWIGLKGILGYRKSVFSLGNDFHFDGIFTSIGLNVDFREITKDIKMYKLKKRYRKDINLTETAVDLITD